MLSKPRVFLVLALLDLSVSTAQAHYNMLLPEVASAKRGDAVTILYQWGHPFEHQLFNAPLPDSVAAFAPDGIKTDLAKILEQVTVVTPEQQKVTAYRLRFTPEQRGDFIFVLNTPPIWMEEDQEFLQDNVKVVLHVQSQQGWDKAAGQDFEMVPLTRPYGLEPGVVFQAQALSSGKRLADGLIEIEHYHTQPPRDLPPDEQITRTAKTDPNGIITCTLTEPGWWCITAQRDGGRKEHAGKSFPMRQRAIFWVFVDDKPSARPAQ